MNTQRQLQYLRIAIRIIRAGEKAKPSERALIVENLETLEKRLVIAAEREAKNGS